MGNWRGFLCCLEDEIETMLRTLTKRREVKPTTKRILHPAMPVIEHLYDIDTTQTKAFTLPWHTFFAKWKGLAGSVPSQETPGFNMPEVIHRKFMTEVSKQLICTDCTQFYACLRYKKPSNRRCFRKNRYNSRITLSLSALRVRGVVRMRFGIGMRW